MLEHSVFGGRLIYGAYRSEPWFFTRLARVYASAFLIIIVLVVFVAVTPVGLPLALAGAIAYALFHAAWWLVENRKVWPLPGPVKRTSVGYQMTRAVALVIGVSTFLYSVYEYTGYTSARTSKDTLWLLYLLAIMSITQYSRKSVVLLTAALSVLSLLVVYTPFMLKGGPLDAQTLLTEVLWIALFSMITFVHVQLVQYRSSNFQLLQHVQQRMANIEEKARNSGKAVTETQLLMAVAQILAQDFRYRYVNMFVRDADMRMLCVASAGKHGDTLARQAYKDDIGVGIIGWVFETGKDYLANNVHHDPNTGLPDPHYKYSDVFPDTVAEFAAPILVNGVPVAVVDVQERIKGAFSEPDLEVMRHLAHYLSNLFANWRHVREQEQVAEIVASLADRFLSEHDLRGVLHTVAELALEHLAADLVRVHEFDPSTGKVALGADAGTYLHPEYRSASIERGNSRAVLLKDADWEMRFHSDPEAPEVTSDPFFAPSADVGARGYPSFPVRERVRSRWTIRLVANGLYVGVMYLNYRIPIARGEPQEWVLRVLARLAALAIRRAQLQQHDLQAENRVLRRTLHQHLKGKVSALSDSVDALARSEDRPYRYDALQDVQDVLQKVLHEVTFLEGTEVVVSGEDLRGPIALAVEKWKKIWGEAPYYVQITLDWQGPPGHTALAHMIATELYATIRELILNAIHHGNPTFVALSFQVRDRELMVSVENDGRNLSEPASPPSETAFGLNDIRKFCEGLGGTFSAVDRLGGGTRVALTIPLTRSPAPK